MLRDATQHRVIPVLPGNPVLYGTPGDLPCIRHAEHKAVKVHSGVGAACECHVRGRSNALFYDRSCPAADEPYNLVDNGAAKYY
jgi:hypothetical protein